MENKFALAITKEYPEDNFNLLMPVKTIAEIAEIHKPVVQTVTLSTNEKDGDIYPQDRRNGEWALTKKGLNMLASAAGITIKDSHSTTPSVCQKCAERNKNSAQAVRCGDCPNKKDVAFTARISVPLLTGQTKEYVESREIIVEDEIIGMSDKQKKEFLKFRSEMCETKAINRAFRHAMNIKSTYTLDELKKPFVVAYLVPNLDHPEVRAEAIKNFFGASNQLYGETKSDSKTNTIAYIETENEKSEQQSDQSYIEAEEIAYESETAYYQPQAQIQSRPQAQPQTQTRQQQSRPEAAQNVCSECGKKISEKVAGYSIKRYNKPLCMDCQNEYRNMGVR